MKNSKFYFFQLFFAFALLFKFSTIEAVTFHAILIGDTDDKELKKVVKKDIQHMEKHFDDVFDFLNVDLLDQTTYTGGHVNTKILSDLENMKIEPEDLIFLYFSGHGFHTTSKETPDWPYLYFTKDDSGVNELKILEILVKHNPKLIICMADCCNNIIKNWELPDLVGKREKARGKSDAAMKNLNRLFLEEKGVIIISSSSPGYYAEGTDEDGSFFTNYYIEAFKKAIHSQEPTSWNDILAQVQSKLCKSQQPQYELILH